MDKTVIEGSRAKSAGIAVLGLIFVAVSWQMIGHVDPNNLKLVLASWAGLVMGVLGFLVGVLRAIKPARLTLGAEGFALEQSFRPRVFYRWDAIARLFIWQHRSVRLVAFDYLPGRQPTDVMTSWAANLGAAGNMGPNWRMKTDDLLVLAVRYHRAAMPQLYESTAPAP